MQRNKITKISRAISIVGTAAIIYVVVPKAYPLLASYEEKIYQSEISEAFGLTNQVQSFFTTGKALEEIKNRTSTPIGFLEIAEDDSNIRSSINLDSDANIAWVANKGDRYAFYEVGDLNGRPWYRVLRPGTINNYYWVSGVIVNVTAPQDDSKLSEFGEETAINTTKDYFEGKKKAYKEQDFTHIAAQLIENTTLFNKEKKYIENDIANGLQTKVLGYEFIDGLYISDDYILVRVAEAYQLKDELGETSYRYLLREYFLRINATSEDMKYYELLNTAELKTQ